MATIIISGSTGTGKSTSIKNLHHEETFYINPLTSSIPFKGSKLKYNETLKNKLKTSNYNLIIKVLDMLINNDKTLSHIKTLIMDDLFYVSSSEYYKRNKESGYNKFNDIALHLQEILNKCLELGERINVVLILHDEDVVTKTKIIGKKIRLIGKMLEKSYYPPELVDVVLFTHVTYDEDNKPCYNFVTNTTIDMNDNGIEIPAKSPEGMFNDILIPNDLKYVFEHIDKYYNEE